MAIRDLFSDKNEKKAKTKVVDAYKKGEKDLTGQYSEALGYYDPYSAGAEGAAGLYSDALGLNGKSGNRNAVNSFQAGPGYRFALDQGRQSVMRDAASRGMLGSGNTNIDLLKYGIGLANQEYGSWLDRLNGQQQFGAGIADRQAAITTGLGDVQYATELGKGGVKGNFQLGKDASGANAIGTITGVASTGARLIGGSASGPKPINRMS